MTVATRTARRGPFLTADWNDLVLANYRVPPELLRPYLPPGSVLDTPDDAPDTHILSLVAFEFSRTRAWGLPVPGGRRFPELNFRFYARRGEKRAAVFLREYVTQPTVVLGARLLYNQPYALARIRHRVERDPRQIRVTTEFARPGIKGLVRLRARNQPFVPSVDSQEHFLKEHYWGFDRDRRGRSFRYRVEHDVWRVYPVEEAVVEFDPGMLLGGAWRSVNWREALGSVMFVEGGWARVYPAEPLEA